MQTIRIQIPETVEYALTKKIADTMSRRAIVNERSGVENGMRWSNYKANPIMINLALDAVFNRKSGADAVEYTGQRQKLRLRISHDTCAPPRDGISHVFTITPV